MKRSFPGNLTLNRARESVRLIWQRRPVRISALKN